LNSYHLYKTMRQVVAERQNLSEGIDLQPDFNANTRRPLMSNNTQTTVQIIANGRCQPNPGPGGYAAVLSTTRNGKAAERVISGTVANVNNQRVQLLAVTEALDALKSPCAVELITYSQYVVKGMTEWISAWLENGWLTSKRKPVKNVDLWQRIHTASEKHQITFIWRQWDSENAEDQRLHNLVAEARDGDTVADAIVEEITEAKAETTEQPEPKVEPVVETLATEKPYRLMISGSRRANWNMLEYARRAVDRAIENGWQIVVGDNTSGVDAEVVRECNLRQYSNIIVVGTAQKPRNGGVRGGRYIQRGSSYSERDQLMAKASNRMLGIWDGKSPGTQNAYQFAQSLNKTAHLMSFASTFAS
jgi:ribonuclease HI